MLFCLCVACSGSGTNASDETPEVEVARAVPVGDVTVMDVCRPVDTGSGRMVPAGAERFMSWAFVDRPYQWVLACSDDVEPYGTAYYRVSEDGQAYPAAGLAPTDLDDRVVLARGP